MAFYDPLLTANKKANPATAATGAVAGAVPVPVPGPAEPTPLAPPSPVVPVNVGWGTSVGDAAPRPPPSVAPPPASPQVPAYVADAIRKMQEKRDKENAMVPDPLAAGAVAGATAGAAAAPAAVEPLPMGSESTMGDTQPAPAPPEPMPVGSEATMNDPAPTPASVEPMPVGSEATMNDTPAPATPPADPLLTPAATDTPDQAAGKTQVQKDLDLIADQFRNWATMKEDPAFVAQFNQTMMTLGLQNQAAADALKMRINADPSLRGQPAGEAIMSLWAAKTGMSRDQLIGQMGVEQAKHIADMNKYGVEGLYKITRDRMSDDEKGLADYGTVMDRMIASGADEATLQAYFDKNIVPLLGGKDITLAQFRSPTERLALITGATNTGLTAMRESLAAGDLAGATVAIEAAYAPAVQIERGKAIIAGGATLEQINGWLEEAGLEAVTDMADLIGREDDVFTAKTIVDAKRKLNESPLQPQIDSMLDTLKGRGFDITDPDVRAAVEEFVYQQNYGDPENPNVLPWDSDATSWQYRDWEIFNPATGALVSKGNELYDSKDNPEPTSGPAYDWKNTLDTQWQKYMRDNPDSKKRLSRDEWFAQFKDAYTKAYQDKPDVGLGDFFARGDWKPEAPTVPIEDRTLTATEIRNTIDAFPDAAALAEWVKNPTNVTAAVESGAIKNFATPSALPSSKAQWDALLMPTTGTAGGLIQFNGKVYQVESQGGHPVRNINNVGDIVVLSDPSTTPPTRYVMKVNSAGHDSNGNVKASEPIGYMVPVDAEGKYTFVPDGTVRAI